MTNPSFNVLSYAEPVLSNMKAPSQHQTSEFNRRRELIEYTLCSDEDIWKEIWKETEESEEAELAKETNKVQTITAVIPAGEVTKNTFIINVGGKRTTEKVVAKGNYSYVDPYITSKNFPMRPRKGACEIVLVEMEQEFSHDDALAKLRELGLKQPLYEDGLFFGEQYPENHWDNPIMFPHEPVPGVRSGPSVVYLWRYDGGRGLGLSLASDRWDSIVRVAGVRN